MRRLISAICCATSLGATLATAQHGDWQEYVYAKDGFAMWAPAKPDFENQTIKRVEGTVDAHIYSIAADGGGLFILLLFQLTSKDRRLDQEVLHRARDVALRVGNGRLISESTVTLGSYPGLEIELASRDPLSKKENIHSRNRYFMVGRQLYQLMSVAPAGEPLSPDTDRWFQSFHLVGRQ